jgi:phage tail protein X
MKPNEFLFESKIVKNPIFEDAYRGARLITEAALSAEQIQQLFAGIEKSAAGGGKNRTLLGKGADAATSVAQAFSKVKQAISQSGPVAGFDAAVDSLQGSIIAATGGENSAVAKSLQGYRNFAKEHPIMQGAIYAVFVALAAIAAGVSGAGAIAAIAGGIKLADRLLQGDKASSAIWKGAKAAGIAYAAASLFGGGSGSQQGQSAQMNPGGQGAVDANQNFFGSHYYGQDGGAAQYTSIHGDTLSQVAADHGVSTDALRAANPALNQLSANAGHSLANPDVLPQGMQLTIPDVSGSTYAGGVGTAANTSGQIAAGNMAPNAISTAQAAKAGLRETKNKALWIDRSATVQRWALNESLGRPRGGLQLTTAGTSAILEGVWDSVKTAAKKGWHDATNKVTANRLDVNWRRGAGRDIAKDGTVDSEVLVKFLRDESITDDVIAAAFAELGIPFGDTAQQAGQQAGQPAQQASGTGVFADPQALAASFEQYMSAGGSVPSAFRGVLKDILSTALSKVESRKVKGRRI